MLNALRNANQSLLIIIVGCIVMGSLIFGLSGSNQRFAENAALETARSYSQTFTSIRNFYQENVVERLQGTNAEIVHNFREVDGAIPIPATMMIELTTYLNKTNTDVTFALVSDYPFPWRSSRPLVDFDVEAIEFLRETGLEEFFEFRVENDGVPPLKWSTFWDRIIPFSGGPRDGWKARQTGRDRAEAAAG